MSNESFKFRCTECDRKLSASSDIAGERIRCPHCAKPITIPVNETVFRESVTAALDAKTVRNMSVPVSEAKIDVPPEPSTKPTKQIKISDTFRKLFKGIKK